MTDPQSHFATGTVDNTREHKWKCAVCGAIGPNPEFDTLDGHAQEKHPEEWRRFVEQGIGEDIKALPIIAVIGGGFAVAIIVFAGLWIFGGDVSYGLGLAVGLLSYLITVVVGYTGMVVTGHV